MQNALTIRDIKIVPELFYQVLKVTGTKCEQTGHRYDIILRLPIDSNDLEQHFPRSFLVIVKDRKRGNLGKNVVFA